MTEGDLYALAEEFEATWSEAGLTAGLTLEFSSRLRRTLGRCLPERRTVRLSSQLKNAPVEFVREVLCHELAHVVAHRRFGPDVRAHGPEWSKLMNQAAYPPKKCMPWVLDGPSKQEGSRSRDLYSHRCPVCQGVRIARTATRRWRCAECAADGLDGQLMVRRISTRGSSA